MGNMTVLPFQNASPLTMNRHNPIPTPSSSITSRSSVRQRFSDVGVRPTNLSSLVMKSMLAGSMNETQTSGSATKHMITQSDLLLIDPVSRQTHTSAWHASKSSKNHESTNKGVRSFPSYNKKDLENVKQSLEKKESSYMQRTPDVITTKKMDHSSQRAVLSSPNPRHAIITSTTNKSPTPSRRLFTPVRPHRIEEQSFPVEASPQAVPTNEESSQRSSKAGILETEPSCGNAAPCRKNDVDSSSQSLPVSRLDSDLSGTPTKVHSYSIGDNSPNGQHQNIVLTNVSSSRVLENSESHSETEKMPIIPSSAPEILDLAGNHETMNRVIGEQLLCMDGESPTKKNSINCLDSKVIIDHQCYRNMRSDSMPETDDSTLQSHSQAIDEEIITDTITTVENTNPYHRAESYELEIMKLDLEGDLLSIDDHSAVLKVVDPHINRIIETLNCKESKRSNLLLDVESRKRNSLYQSLRQMKDCHNKVANQSCFDNQLISGITGVSLDESQLDEASEAIKNIRYIDNCTKESSYLDSNKANGTDIFQSNQSCVFSGDGASMEASNQDMSILNFNSGYSSPLKDSLQVAMGVKPESTQFSEVEKQRMDLSDKCVSTICHENIFDEHERSFHSPGNETIDAEGLSRSHIISEDKAYKMPIVGHLKKHHKSLSLDTHSDPRYRSKSAMSSDLSYRSKSTISSDLSYRSKSTLSSNLSYRSKRTISENSPEIPPKRQSPKNQMKMIRAWVHERQKHHDDDTTVSELVDTRSDLSNRSKTTISKKSHAIPPKRQSPKNQIKLVRSLDHERQKNHDDDTTVSESSSHQQAVSLTPELDELDDLLQISPDHKELLEEMYQLDEMLDVMLVGSKDMMRVNHPAPSGRKSIGTSPAPKPTYNKIPLHPTPKRNQNTINRSFSKQLSR